MSTEQETAQTQNRTVLYLDPDDILIPEESNVRPYVGGAKLGDDEKEIQDLEKLGQSIASIGQLQPIVVVRNTNVGGPQYSLIAGRRRTKAVKMYNLGADTPIKLEAVIDPIKNDKTRAKSMFQHALHENVHRKNLNPIQFALNVQVTRGKMTGSKGAAQTQKIAEFFGVSPAAITQAEKLLELPEDLQTMVADGRLSGEAAQEVIKHGKTPEERKEIVETAQTLQAEEEAEVSQPDAVTEDAMANKKPKRKARKSKSVKTKHVRTAARKVTGASTKRSRTEVLDFFRSQLGPVNGHPNGAIHMFCDGLLMWVEGKVSDKKLNSLWDALVKKADRGTPEKEEKVAAPPPGPSRKLGAAGKPAGKKKVAKSRKKK